MSALPYKDLFVLFHQGHQRNVRCAGITAEDQVDLIDGDRSLVVGDRLVGIAFVVIDDQLHRSAQEATLLVDVLCPGFIPGLDPFRLLRGEPRQR